MYKNRCCASTLSNHRCKRTATYISSDWNTLKLKFCTQHCKEYLIANEENENKENENKENENIYNINKKHFKSIIIFCILLSVIIGVIYNFVQCALHDSLVRENLLKYISHNLGKIALNKTVKTYYSDSKNMVEMMCSQIDVILV
jgi:hypothetical protein